MKRNLLIALCIILVGQLTHAQQTGTLTDKRDRKTYNWVNIGSLKWMVENLNFRTDKGSWCYVGKSINCDKYGRLYNWKTAMIACPDGWHLPGNEEWDELLNFLDGDSIAGGQLKAIDTTLWRSPNKGATNSSGFTALPGGYSISEGVYRHVGNTAYFWTASEYQGRKSWYRYMYYSNTAVYSLYHNKDGGFSVRCVQD